MITSEDEVVPVGLCHGEECQKLWGLAGRKLRKSINLSTFFRYLT
jgi:hypothetical protein